MEMGGLDGWGGMAVAGIEDMDDVRGTVGSGGTGREEVGGVEAGAGRREEDVVVVVAVGAGGRGGGRDEVGFAVRGGVWVVA